MCESFLITQSILLRVPVVISPLPPLVCTKYDSVETLSVTWVLRHDHNNVRAVLISNSVTDEANVAPVIGQPKTYLSVDTRQIDNEHHLQAKVTIKSPLYYYPKL